MTRQLVSIIVPFFNEAPNLTPLHKEITKHTKALPYDFELIFVDDGSTDNSATIAHHLADTDKHVHYLGLSRNFGKEAAMTAGLNAADGDAAIIIDADMQMPPSLLGEFLAKWKGGADVVVGVFAGRNTSSLHKIGSSAFYRIMQSVSQTKITPHATDYRLLDRKVINVFSQLPEHNRITRGLIDWLGFRRDYLPFKQEQRLHGRPTYDFRKLLKLAINSLTSNSLMPLKLAGYIGGAILILSLPIGALMTLERFVFHAPIRGTAFLAILLVAMVGLILVCLGFISLYIANIVTEVTARPLYVVREDTSSRSLPYRRALPEGSAE
ncbi:MAG TPA: glycosyltransferase family 2 protein [Candidatus Saccharimonadales bacterium]|nr:glycosyltransferase family 2 protein [Candidatus Saccharimonadales bacterium]